MAFFYFHFFLILIHILRILRFTVALLLFMFIYNFKTLIFSVLWVENLCFPVNVSLGPSLGRQRPRAAAAWVRKSMGVRASQSGARIWVADSQWRERVQSRVRRPRRFPLSFVNAAKPPFARRPPGPRRRDGASAMKHVVQEENTKYGRRVTDRNYFE